jgi:hypothetical protein
MDRTVCENDGCNNLLTFENDGSLCSGYMDCSEGERWCSCCNECRAQCHLGALEELEENED